MKEKCKVQESVLCSSSIVGHRVVHGRTHLHTILKFIVSQCIARTAAAGRNAGGVCLPFSRLWALFRRHVCLCQKLRFQL
jgi:hypothetical protein